MPDEQPHDPLPAFLAELEQSIKMLVQTAPQMASASKVLYDSYRGEGFSEKQALYLTAAYWKNPETPSE